MSHPRRTKIIKPGLQLRIIGTFFFVAISAALIQVLTLRYILQKVARGLPSDGGALREMIPDMVLDGSVMTAVALVPLVTFVGVMVTIRIAGPVHAFEAYLTSFLGGQRPAPCRLRKGDEFKDLCKLINASTQSNLEKLPTIMRSSAAGSIPAAALPATAAASEVLEK